MPNVTSVCLYPYSGWWDRSWGSGSGDATPAFDAAARTARRVTESLTQEFVPLALVAPPTRLMAALHTSTRPDVEVMPVDRADDFLGHLTVPPGFHRLSPPRRRELIGDAVEHLLLASADHLGWDRTAITDAVARARSTAYRCTWESGWKATRDRRRRVRLEGELADDGFFRCRVVVADADETPVLTSDSWIGWTWVENLVRGARGMRFVDRDTLTVPSGSSIDASVTTVDLATGSVTCDPEHPTPLAYPGDPEPGTEPRLVVRPWSLDGD